VWERPKLCLTTLQLQVQAYSQQKHSRQAGRIRDKPGMLAHRAALLARLERGGEAAVQYRELLATNPDHYRW
jgi:hypothetical protein